MSEPQGRIFVYTPPDQQPTGAPHSGYPGEYRSWLHSPIAVIGVWILALVSLVPAGLFLILLLPEQYGLLLTGAGLWLVFGIAAFHWWLPAATEDYGHSEGLAVGGWHILISVVGSGGIAWLLLFPGSLRPAFTLGELRPVIVVSILIVGVSGVLLCFLRGYRPGRALRYSWTLSWMLVAWMTLWLTASHAGL